MHAWTTELLDEMRRTGDPEADATLANAAELRDIRRISESFRSFAADDAEIPPDAPREFPDFVAATRALPHGIDRAQVARGGEVMLENASVIALVLLLKSLPCGYGAPRLSTVLHMSHNLEKRPYRRALGVLQMLVNISQPGAFRDGGGAVVTGQKLRLLHAGVRRVVRARIAGFEQEFGTPVSQLDMVYTSMTFSVLVVDGLADLGVCLSEQDAGDYFYLWQMYGEMQGIRREWMPRSLEDGRAFCAAYAREFRNAADNPHGIALTRADLDMMKSLIPWPLRMLGFGTAPTVYLLRLVGEEAAARVGVVMRARHTIADWLVIQLPAVWQRLWKTLAPEAKVHTAISRMFFRSLIVHAWGEEVRFGVPERLRDLRKLA
ncbi:DUF2236 domain-containing protein [Ramlibacter terrae]|uniref:DUF2236 domain-containing protein n=1 Tax=Ramlibacter terrae TaxID=2732511 RepID=A0ABX6P2U0_9BURK|nr:DUF2236 domain-containing protein [Ramlibacter terrae]